MPTTKGIRLDEDLRQAFEQHCRAHLLDERAVIEAWLLRFLEASEEERVAAAKRYAEWRAMRDGSPNASKPAKGKKGGPR